MSYVLASIFNKLQRGEKLSDLEFLAVKAYEGKIVRTTATLTSSSTTMTYTVPNGKTAYVMRASATPFTAGSASTRMTRTSLVIDGTTLGYVWGGLTVSSINNRNVPTHELGDTRFDTEGAKLEGDGTKTIQMIASGNNSVHATLIVLLEDTGTSPAL